jgi:tRNA dimethylallyltransferase
MVLFLVGPTAVGKSKLAVALAHRLGGEIISADSMQIYRGMDIGTAKPTLSERQKIPHHMLDVVSPSQPFSVYKYRLQAIHKMTKLITRGKLPIVTGGSGLYVRSLLEGLSRQPGPDFSLRRRLQKDAKERGSAFLHQRLRRLDPRTARKIHFRDTKRVIRALEIFQQSGTKPSDWHLKKGALTDYGIMPVVIGVTKERAALYEEIERRVDSMFRNGLVQEARRLFRKRISKTAAQAVGYREIWNALRESGKDPHQRQYLLDQARSLIKLHTRHLAKRQMTWFKKEKGIRWLAWLQNESMEAMCDKIIKEMQNAS